MSALALILGVACGLAITPPTVRALAAVGLRRANYRGSLLPCPAGVAIAAAALLAMIPLCVLERVLPGRVLPAEAVPVALYALGAALLGLLDDLLGGGAAPAATGAASAAPRVPSHAPPRGWRGHARAVLAGRPSTGALKALGALGLALLALHGYGDSLVRYALAAGVLVLATNALNLLDLRPGRAIKALALLGVALGLASRDARPLAALGAFLGPALIVGGYDLRERAMLGDAGSNLLGALAGLWLVLALDASGQAIALATLALVTVYGEFRSIGALIERTPVLRHLDSLGRPLHA